MAAPFLADTSVRRNLLSVLLLIQDNPWPDLIKYLCLRMKNQAANLKNFYKGDTRGETDT